MCSSKCYSYKINVWKTLSNTPPVHTWLPTSYDQSSLINKLPSQFFSIQHWFYDPLRQYTIYYFDPKVTILYNPYHIRNLEIVRLSQDLELLIWNPVWRSLTGCRSLFWNFLVSYAGKDRIVVRFETWDPNAAALGSMHCPGSSANTTSCRSLRNVDNPPYSLIVRYW